MNSSEIQCFLLLCVFVFFALHYKLLALSLHISDVICVTDPIFFSFFSSGVCCLSKSQFSLLDIVKGVACLFECLPLPSDS